MVPSAVYIDSQRAEHRQRVQFQMTETIRKIARDRDTEAFQEFFLEFAPRVKALLLRQGADMATAEEIAQETMLTVWRKAHMFCDSRGSIASWVFTIARNLKIDRLRKDVAWQEFVNIVPDRASDEPLADDIVSSNQVADRIRSGIAELPEELRAVIVLSFLSTACRTTKSPAGSRCRSAPSNHACGWPISSCANRLRA